MEQTIINLPKSISSSAMLVSFSVGNWTARKLDKKVSDEVDQQKNTQTKAGNYHKNLLAGAEILTTLNKYVANVRNEHYRMTQPWSDSGMRVVSMKRFFDHKAKVNEWMTGYNDLTDKFFAAYPTMVTAAAFQLGDMFDRSEYPDVDVLRGKFYMNVNYWPVPEAGDFRVDCEDAVREALAEEYHKLYQGMVNTAMGDAWGRLHGVLTKMVDRLTDDAQGEQKIFQKSMLANAEDLVDTLASFNITGDPKLEEARIALAKVINGVTVKDLRESKAVRVDVRTQVEDILSKFNF